MSSSPRPSRNAARTKPAARLPAFSSDTNARQNRGPTSWPCQREFFRPHSNEVCRDGESKHDSFVSRDFRFARNSYRNYSKHAGWSSLVARQAHNLKVAGSNPAPATNFFQHRAATAALFWAWFDETVLAAQYGMAPAVGFEPTTNRLTADRSTTELRWITQ